MSIKITLIRHGKTAGNLKGAYIGRTDESLCQEGIAVLAENKIMGLYPETSGSLYVSPLKRCQETAALLYPKTEQKMIEDFRETDFGDFEGKTYEDLNGNPIYQHWIDSGGTEAFPHGESPLAFKKRCTAAFEALMNNQTDEKPVTIICHGGTIMAILEKYAEPHQDFYCWQVKNGKGFCGKYANGKLTEIQPLEGEKRD